MASGTIVPCVQEIGETAGRVWHALDDDGPQPLSQLIKQIGVPRDVVMQAVGWLAHEEKIWIESDGRKRIVSLR